MQPVRSLSTACQKRPFVEPTLREEAGLADVTLITGGISAGGDPACQGPPPKPAHCE